MKKFIKKFKELWQKEFAKELREYREFLWYARLFFLGLVTERTFTTIQLFVDGEIKLINMILSLIVALIIALVPYAYGIDSMKEQQEK